MDKYKIITNLIICKINEYLSAYKDIPSDIEWYNVANHEYYLPSYGTTMPKPQPILTCTIAQRVLDIGSKTLLLEITNLDDIEVIEYLCHNCGFTKNGGIIYNEYTPYI